MNKFKNEEYYLYLDTLRDSGVTNMFEAVLYLMNEYLELSNDEAKQILLDWMNLYGERYETKRVSLDEIKFGGK